MKKTAGEVVERVVGAYIRVSTEGQREGMGLEAQRRAIIAYAATSGMDIRLWFQDVESGSKEERAGLNKLRDAAGAGGLSDLLVYRLDRIARDVRLGENLLHELQQAGVRVLSASEGMDDTPSGFLMRTVLMALAQYERSLIAIRTGTGRRLKVSTAGTFHGGTAPYGYVAVGDRMNSGHGELVVDEQAAEVVRVVFEMHGAGRNGTEIAGALNNAGHRTARGALFTPVQVGRILKRRKVYAGLTTATPSIGLGSGVKAKQAPILDRL